VGILNNRANVEQIKEEIKRYIEENDNGEVNPAILWDGMKAVIRGKLIALTASQKKARLAIYKRKVEKLQELEKKHKNAESQSVLQQIKKLREEINEILRTDIEKRARFVKQAQKRQGS